MFQLFFFGMSYSSHICSKVSSLPSLYRYATHCTPLVAQSLKRPSARPGVVLSFTHMGQRWSRDVSNMLVSVIPNVHGKSFKSDEYGYSLRSDVVVCSIFTQAGRVLEQSTQLKQATQWIWQEEACYKCMEENIIQTEKCVKHPKISGKLIFIIIFNNNSCQA